ncbi:hypothetical protein BCR35DRAFT_302700 [Leucosporidium creatinivorum]|uniref:NodB homology domain-containing protein n=1 Tax=Leucosporidium creatinivorum TaxID=106004 RepID=A0A1Y2FPY2_9BASI|nr:hypothetical protein BCR35DRAFT_302700 [Leucosporidium creatinivorum]
MLLHTLLPAALLFSSSVAGLAIPEPSSANSTLFERDLERRSSDGVITTCTKPKTFAMTFDDGPYQYGSTIANYFTKHNVKTTFFVNGNNFDCIYDRADDLIARYKQGHQIASHTWSHPDISTLTDAQLNGQLTFVETALKKILGVKPRFFRPPYGSYNAANLRVLKSRGYKVVTWNFDSLDADGATAAQSIASFKKLEPGFPKTHISLDHETHETTASKIVPTIVPRLIKDGWKLVTVADCLGESPYQSTGTPGKRDKTWTCAGTPAPGAAA